MPDPSSVLTAPGGLSVHPATSATTSATTSTTASATTPSAAATQIVFGRPTLVVTNPVEKGRDYRQLIWGPFLDAAARLGGAPGQMLEPDKAPEAAGRGSRVRFQDGSIYLRPDGGTAWVHGAIGDRYDQLGGAGGYLGLPLTDESDFSENGRFNAFENGGIYFWPDTGAIDLREVVIAYTGLLCFGETDHDGDATPAADEPYVLLGVVDPAGAENALRSQVYDDVDAGESRPDRLELYRGAPRGLVVAATLMEHDFGNPDEFRSEVEKFVAAVSDEIPPVLMKVPKIGVILAAAATLVLGLLKGTITDFPNGLLDTDDDNLGGHVFVLSAKDMVVLSSRSVPDVYQGVSSKSQSPLLGSGEGASYKVCLTADAV